jgi:hypothetical protein
LLVSLVALALGITLVYPAHTASATDGVYPDTVVINLPHEVKKSHMLVIDLNADGKGEILAAADNGHLMVIDGASYGVVWDKDLADYLPNYNTTRMTAGLAMGDLDLDGKLELVVATGAVDPLATEGPGAVLVLTYVGAPGYFSLMPGWPRMGADSLGPKGTPDAFAATPSLGDMDGDGDLEIIIGGMDRRLYLLHHDGTDALGWPLDYDDKYYRDNRSTAAVADMDGDGLNEIIIGSNNYVYPACPNPYLFYVLNGDGTPTPGFPLETTQNIESAPAVADLDGDGYLDIVFGTGDYGEHCRQPADGKKVYAVDRFGQPLPGWPVRTNADMLNAPAIGDLDNDGSPEVVIYNATTLYAWHADGRPVRGFPQHGAYYIRFHTPVLADVDGDGAIEILLGTGQIYGGDGRLKEMRVKLQTPLIVTDQDGDGLLESIGANNWNRSLYIWQERGPATGLEPWPMFHRTADRAGVLPTGFSLQGRVIDEANRGAAGIHVTLSTGQVAVTDADGAYRFGNLPEGEYTLTPWHAINRFKPMDRTVYVAGNTTAKNIIMLPPYYTLRGAVFHANGAPYSNVTLALNNGMQAVSDAAGQFRIPEVLPGQYILTPQAPNALFLPAQRTLSVDLEEAQTFVALSMPTAAALSGDQPTQVEFLDTQGLPTRLIFPAGMGDAQAVTVTPLLPEKVDGFVFVGHAFAIEADPPGATVDSPFSIRITYNEQDLRSLVRAGSVRLLWRSPNGWVDAEESCSVVVAATHDPEARTVSSTVCQWGVYGLFGPLQQNYLPLIPTARP